MTAKPHLDRGHARHLLGQMLRIRLFEEKCAELYTQQKIRGFLHLYIGEEANAAGVATALSADDSIVATYREHGHALARGIAMGPLMAECTASRTGHAEAAAAPCTSSTGRPASTAAMRS